MIFKVYSLYEKLGKRILTTLIDIHVIDTGFNSTQSCAFDMKIAVLQHRQVSDCKYLMYRKELKELNGAL